MVKLCDYERESEMDAEMKKSTERDEKKRAEKEREVVTERWMYMEKLDYRMKMRTSIL